MRKALTLAAILLAATPLLAGCGPSTPNAKHAKVAVGTLPAGATFTGVWHNPIWGDLHLVQEGGSVHGKWKSASSGVWGQLTGGVEGDVIHFDWEEHKTGAIGPGSTRTGHGYFKYVDRQPPDLPEMKGEWGIDDNEVGGGEWDCKKMKDLVPDLKSVGGDSDAGVDTGWDQPVKKGQ